MSGAPLGWGQGWGTGEAREWAAAVVGGPESALCGETGSSLGRRGEHCGVQRQEVSAALRGERGTGRPAAGSLTRWRPRIRSVRRDAENWGALAERRICGEGSLRCFVREALSVIAAVPFEGLAVKTESIGLDFCGPFRALGRPSCCPGGRVKVGEVRAAVGQGVWKQMPP